MSIKEGEDAGSSVLFPRVLTQAPEHRRVAVEAAYATAWRARHRPDQSFRMEEVARAIEAVEADMGLYDLAYALVFLERVGLLRSFVRVDVPGGPSVVYPNVNDVPEAIVDPATGASFPIELAHLVVRFALVEDDAASAKVSGASRRLP